MSEKEKKSPIPEEVTKIQSSDEPERAQWGNHCEGFLSSLGLAVGLGNIWR